MKSVLAGLGALTILAASMTTALASDVEYPPAYETCGDICRLQRYIDSDHMVTLVPAPSPAGIPAALKRGTARSKTVKRALASTSPARPALPRVAGVTDRPVKTAVRLAPLPSAEPAPIATKPSPEPASTAAAMLPPKAAPVIPGSAPVIMNGFQIQ